MLDFKLIKDKANNQEWLETSLVGKLLLTTPQLNKGTAFTEEERKLFGLLGKLPAYVETLAQQVKRTYVQYQGYTNDLQKNIYLNNLHDKNQVLFYKLVSEHLAEMLPLVYTPIVGNAVKGYSREFRQARGLYIAYPYLDDIETILDNRSHPEIDLILVTDGEGVLGIGDQGIGAMDICIAKLMVYTLCAGINPLRTLPIILDVGTNNQTLLNDPLYLGLRHPRIAGPAYDEFIERFINAVKRKFPTVFLHWEDFGRQNARRNLDKYRDVLCSFNDDIQGTGVVTLATVLAAIKAADSQLQEQRIVIFGAGTAGTGVADQLCAAMQRAGIPLQTARQQFWLVDRQGLLINDMQDLTISQQPYARNHEEITSWQKNDLAEVVKQVRPTLLIGCSAQAGAFTKDIVQTMAQHASKPIILPLSNPNDFAEAHPADLLSWTDDRALVATGSPFPDVEINGKKIRIAQCNNALAFPGIGLGILAVKAKRVSDDMLWAACQTLCNYSPALTDPTAPLLPNIEVAKPIARAIAIAVAKQAQLENLASLTEPTAIEAAIDEVVWEPHYVPLRKNANP